MAEPNGQADLRGAYETLAVHGKVAFVEHVLAYLERARMTQREFAEITGYSTVSVSEFLRLPERAPENFIRVVSLTVPELAGEYLEFRLVADEPFYERATEAQLERMKLVRQLQEQSEILGTLERATDAILRLLRHLKTGR